METSPRVEAQKKEVKVLWDFEIRTDKVIATRRQEIVVVDIVMRTTIVIDVAVPLDWKVKGKEDEKVLKYQDLGIEIQTPWNTKAKIVPIIVGSLGAT